MPEISRFFGIAIAMYYQEGSPARLHALSGTWAAAIDVETGAVEGHFPPRALGLVQEWRERYQSELCDNWRRARLRLPLRAVPPLE
jgi:hypothetical protein